MTGRPSMSDAPRVAIVGAGAIGRGFASLAAAHGWFTALYDPETRAIDSAFGEIQRRVKALVALGRADKATADIGLSRLRVGRSLLQACGDANWIIEAAPEELAVKQRIFENVEQVAQKEAIMSSCSSGLGMTEMGARCRDQTRLVVTHPLNPPELIPLIEVVPGKFTSKATVDAACERLRALGRLP